VTPAELRTARKALGLTQHGLAEAFGMGKWGFQSVAKWEKGQQPIPTWVDLALEGLAARIAQSG